MDIKQETTPSHRIPQRKQCFLGGGEGGLRPRRMLIIPEIHIPRFLKEHSSCMEVISESEFREICKGLWCKGWRKAASAPRARQEQVRTTSPLLAPTATSAVVNICTEQQEILGREENAAISGTCALVCERGAAGVSEGNLGSTCPTGRRAERGLSADRKAGVRGGGHSGCRRRGLHVSAVILSAAALAAVPSQTRVGDRGLWHRPSFVIPASWQLKGASFPSRLQNHFSLLLPALRSAFSEMKKLHGTMESFFFFKDELGKTWGTWGDVRPLLSWLLFCSLSPIGSLPEELGTGDEGGRGIWATWPGPTKATRLTGKPLSKLRNAIVGCQCHYPVDMLG